MNNEIEIFKNEEFGQIRTMLINNEPYFVGKDVAEDEPREVNWFSENHPPAVPSIFQCTWCSKP